MDKQKTIEALQFFVTNLSNQAFAHKLQGKFFASEGFERLGAKYTGHYDEEMAWVDKFIDRILDLGGEIKHETRPESKIITEPCDYIKNELQVSIDGIELLRKCMASLYEDVTTYDIMKEYLKDEEEDMYWSEQQLYLIERLGYEPWLMKQM